MYGRMATRATHLDGVMREGGVPLWKGQYTLGESHASGVSGLTVSRQQSGSCGVPYWEWDAVSMATGSSRPCLHWGENSLLSGRVGLAIGHIQASRPHPLNHRIKEEEVLDYEEDELPGAGGQQEGEQGEQKEECSFCQQAAALAAAAAAAAAAAPVAPARALARLDFANPDRPLAAMCRLPIMAPCGMHPRSNHTNGGCMGQEQWRAAVMQGPHQAVARALVAHQQRERHMHEQHAAQQVRALVHDRIARRQQHLPVPSPPPAHEGPPRYVPRALPAIPSPAAPAPSPAAPAPSPAAPAPSPAAPAPSPAATRAALAAASALEWASQPQLARFGVPSLPPAHERYERAGRRQSARYRYRSRTRSPPPRPHQPPRYAPRALPAIPSPAAPAPSPAAPAPSPAAPAPSPAALAAASALPAELSPALLQALAGLRGGAGVMLFLPR